MWRIREFHADDLDAAVRLWDDPAASSEAPLFGLSDLIVAVRSHQPAVVAVVGEELVGVAVATVSGDQAWEERLLICATNSVRALDSAFLRHGRFDYVLPIGPPDPAARQAIWDRYLAAVPHDELDMDAIVTESQLFTPADIEFAVRIRRTAQLAFERVLFEQGKELVTTGDILHAISQTRRTLTPELVAEFEQDITEYARI
jgi:transitional endoplasmic reticulum ATPase